MSLTITHANPNFSVERFHEMSRNKSGSFRIKGGSDHVSRRTNPVADFFRRIFLGDVRTAENIRTAKVFRDGLVARFGEQSLSPETRALLDTCINEGKSLKARAVKGIFSDIQRRDEYKLHNVSYVALGGKADLKELKPDKVMLRLGDFFLSSVLGHVNSDEDPGRGWAILPNLSDPRIKRIRRDFASQDIADIMALIKARRSEASPESLEKWVCSELLGIMKRIRDEAKDIALERNLLNEDEKDAPRPIGNPNRQDRAFTKVKRNLNAWLSVFARRIDGAHKASISVARG